MIRRWNGRTVQVERRGEQGAAHLCSRGSQEQEPGDQASSLARSSQRPSRHDTPQFRTLTFGGMSRFPLYVCGERYRYSSSLQRRSLYRVYPCGVSHSSSSLEAPALGDGSHLYLGIQKSPTLDRMIDSDYIRWVGTIPYDILSIPSRITWMVPCL